MVISWSERGNKLITACQSADLSITISWSEHGNQRIRARQSAEREGGGVMLSSHLIRVVIWRGKFDIAVNKNSLGNWSTVFSCYNQCHHVQCSYSDNKMSDCVHYTFSLSNWNYGYILFNRTKMYLSAEIAPKTVFCLIGQNI